MPFSALLVLIQVSIQRPVLFWLAHANQGFEKTFTLAGLLFNILCSVSFGTGEQ